MGLRPALSLLAVLVALGLAACGDDDSDTTPASGEGAASPPAETQAPETQGETEEGEADGEEANAPAPSGEAPRSAKVEIVDFEFDPSTVTIEEGGKVIWQNQDAEEHTATLDDGSFDSGPLAEGKLKSESFKRPGTYAYHCEIHPEMTGTVEVVGG